MVELDNIFSTGCINEHFEERLFVTNWSQKWRKILIYDAYPSYSLFLLESQDDVNKKIYRGSVYYQEVLSNATILLTVNKLTRFLDIRYLIYRGN